LRTVATATKPSPSLNGRGAPEPGEDVQSPTTTNATADSVASNEDLVPPSSHPADRYAERILHRQIMHERRETATKRGHEEGIRLEAEKNERVSLKIEATGPRRFQQADAFPSDQHECPPPSGSIKPTVRLPASVSYKPVVVQRQETLKVPEACTGSPAGRSGSRTDDPSSIPPILVRVRLPLTPLPKQDLLASPIAGNSQKTNDQPAVYGSEATDPLELDVLDVSQLLLLSIRVVVFH
jgi:hypothetical protein